MLRVAAFLFMSFIFPRADQRLAIGPGDSGAGLRAPRFLLKTSDGKAVDSRDFRGKAIILTWWAKWCAPCRSEVPALNAIYRRHQGKDVVVLAMYGEDDASLTDVQQAAKKFGIEYPVALCSLVLVTHYGGMIALPTTFVIDRQGNLVERIIGEASEERLTRDLAKALEAR
jgi:peroxiredoxin